MSSNALFDPMFSTPAMAAATSDGAWLAAMLRFEAALADGCAAEGLIPESSAATIRELCRAHDFDPVAIGVAGAMSANPVVALVAAVRAALPAEARADVHLGATSQDVLDTAAMLVIRDALDLLIADATRACDAAARLASDYRDTVMIGRTLMQQAVPITFGLKAANWLTALSEARGGLLRVRRGRLALQFGGAAGTLAGPGPAAPRVAERLAEALGLPLPPLPWHTNRVRIAEIAAAVGVLAGVAGKVALDVILLAQSEVGEVSEGGAGGRSSAMPQKRNPASSISAVAAARHAQTFVPAFFGAMLQQHERGAGSWQSEWPAFGPLLCATASAVQRVGGVLEGLRVDSEVMRANLDRARGLPLAESAAVHLAAQVGREKASQVVEAAVGQVLAGAHPTLIDALQADSAASEALTVAELASALDPASALGQAGASIDAALAAWAEAKEARP